MRVPGCSISSKSRCSDGAATHRAGQSAHFPAEAGRLCLCCDPLPGGLAGLFFNAPVSTRNSQSPFYPLARVLQAVRVGLPEPSCQSRGSAAPANRFPPISRAPCWLVEAEQAGSPGGEGEGVCYHTGAPGPVPRVPSMPPLWPGALPYDTSPCPDFVAAKVHGGSGFRLLACEVSTNLGVT